MFKKQYILFCAIFTISTNIFAVKIRGTKTYVPSLKALCLKPVTKLPDEKIKLLPKNIRNIINLIKISKENLDDTCWEAMRLRNNAIINIRLLRDSASSGLPILEEKYIKNICENIISVDDIELLLEAGADMNTFKNDTYPVMYAVSVHDFDLVKMLCSSKFRGKIGTYIIPTLGIEHMGEAYFSKPRLMGYETHNHNQELLEFVLENNNDINYTVQRVEHQIAKLIKGESDNRAIEQLSKDLELIKKFKEEKTNKQK